MKRQKTDYAAGPDDIMYDYYKDGGDVVIDSMTELFN